MTDINICMLGDGLVKGIGDGELLGWAGRLIRESNKEHGPLTYYNLGVPDQTSQEVSQRLSELKPRMKSGEDNRLILSFGLADTEIEENKTRLTSQQSLDGLKTILMATRPHYKMIMVGPPPVYETQRNARIKRLNNMFREVAAKARLPYVDIFTVLIDDIQYKRGLARGDKVHPTDEGYEKIFDLIWNDRVWWFN